MVVRGALMAALVMSLGAIGCSDDDAEPDPVEQLHGGWNTSTEVYFQFDDDGTWIAAESEGLNPFDVGTYTFDGITLTYRSGEGTTVCTEGDTGVAEVSFADEVTFSLEVETLQPGASAGFETSRRAISYIGVKVVLGVDGPWPEAATTVSELTH